MSEIERQAQPHPVAQDDTNVVRINLEAGGWIERRDFGNWTEKDRAEFDAWLDAAPEHRVAYLRLDTGWQRSEIMVALRPFRLERVMSNVPRQSWSLRKIVAGLALVLALGGVATDYAMIPRQHTYATTVGGHKTLMLADGSQIELNTDTVLRVVDKADQRMVWLDRGEAYFQVKHDAARPLVVKTGNYRVTDLGTKFVVRTADDKIEVALVEGHALFQSADASIHPQLADLTPGDVAVATANSMSVVKKSARDLTYDLGWRRGLLMFHNTTLLDAAAEFNRYNDNKLIVSDRDAARLRINGTFPVHDVAVFARVAKDVFGLRVKSDANGTTISR
jgi:transmembrane sensor